jgi:hypothetical protein
MATKYITEILDEVNKDPQALSKYKTNAALKFIFQHAFLPELKFDLPDGAPPYKEDVAPLGMSPANLIMETKKLYMFTKQKTLNKVRKEQLFIQLLENVHPSEAKLLIAVKDQKLNKLYKKVTAELVAEHGFIPTQKKNEESTPKKS